MTGREIRWRSNRPRVAALAAALLGALALSFAAGAEADAAKEKRGGDNVRRYVVPVDSPESVIYDGQTNAFYGGSSNPDGRVYKARLDGKARVFMRPGEDGEGNPDDRTQTEGFNVDKEGRLYIAGSDSGQLHVYDLPSGSKIAQFDTGLGGFINDVDIDPENGDVYFTDSLRPFIFRVTEAQVESGVGEPQSILLDDPTDEDDVDYTPSTRTDNKLEANGIRFTPGGEFIIFDSLNNGELYRLTPLKGDPEENPIVEPNEREIVTIGGVTPAQIGNADGLEFLDGNTLYSVDNSSTIDDTPESSDESSERIVKLRLSDDYLTAEVLEERKSDKFRTPTSVSKAPRDRLLVNNAEFFDGDGMEPFFVLSIPRP